MERAWLAINLREAIPLCIIQFAKYNLIVITASCLDVCCVLTVRNTGLSKKMDGILNRYNLKSTGRIYTFGVLKCSEKFKVLDLP